MGRKVYYVVGHTGKGVYDDGPYDAYIDVKKIRELYTITQAAEKLTVGANVSLTDLLATLTKQSATPGFAHLSAVVDLISKTAHHSVRNVRVRNFCFTKAPNSLFSCVYFAADWIVGRKFGHEE